MIRGLRVPVHLTSREALQIFNLADIWATRTGQEVRLVRAALENLLWDVPWDEPLATKLQTLLAQLPTASAGADSDPPVERTGSGAVASPG